MSRNETLKTLLDEATGEYTLREVAEKAGFANHQAVAYLAKKETLVRFPDPKNIAGLAGLLNRPVGMTLLAVGRTVGMAIEPVPALAWQLPKELDDLTETERVELLKLIKDFVASKKRKRRRGR